MAEPKHLWEAEHSYYGPDDNLEEFESFADFLDEWAEMDNDRNLLVRWDWERASSEDLAERIEEGGWPEGKDCLQLFFVLQRKSRTSAIFVAVTEDDEPAVLKYLTPKARHIATLWEPIWQGGAA